MNLSKAIAGLEDLLVDDPHFDPERRREAIRLGIEALKVIKEYHDYFIREGVIPLPGETGE